MPIVADAAVAVRADMKGFDSGLKAAEAKTKTFGQKVNAALNPKNIAGGLGAAFLGSQVVGFLNDSAAAASNLEEAQSKVNVVFGEGADDITKWAEGSAEGFLMSKSAALEAAGTYGNLFQAFGIGQEEASEMSTTLVELAADLASFNNTSVEDALLALRSGLSGETEPLKRYGVAINQARLETAALEAGIWDGVGALDAGQKAQASYVLILEDTALAQGDVARTGEGLANQQREMAAKIENAMAEIGKSWASVQLGAIKVVETLGGVAEFLGQDIDLWPFDNVEEDAKATAAAVEATVQAANENFVAAGEERIAQMQAGRPAMVTAADSAIRDPVIEAMLGGKEEAERIAGETPGGIAQALLDNQFSVEDAMAEMARVAEEALHPVIERAQIIGFLASSGLAEKLNSGIPAVAAAAQAVKQAAEDRLSVLSGDAFYWGLNSAQSYASGLNAGYGYVLTAAGTLAAATRNQIGINSEPSDHSSPLYGITKWGGNIARTIADGINSELGLGRSAARNLAASLVPGFAGVGMDSRMGGAAGGGGGVNNYYLTVQGKEPVVSTAQQIVHEMSRLGSFRG